MGSVPELRFPEFSGEWKVLKLGDIGNVSMCKRILKHQTSPSEEIPFYKIGTFGKEPDTYISKDIFNEYVEKYSYPKPGDILISAAGTIGRTVVFDGSPAYFQDSNIVWIDNHEEVVKNNFLKFYYETIRWVTEDTTIARLYNNNLRSIKIAAPSLPEQQKIADFLTAIDEKITILTDKITQLQTYKKGMMQKLLSGELRFPGFTDEWRELKLGEICDIVGGGTPSTTDSSYWNGDIPWFTPTEIKGRYCNKSKRTITEDGLKNSSAKLLPAGTLLLTTRATIGDVCIAKHECTTNQGFQNLIAIENKSYNIYLYYWIQTQRNELLRKANGSTFLEISSKEIKKLDIRLPSLSEQVKIADSLTAIDDKLTIEQEKLDQLKTYKQGLLQKMFV